MTQPANDSDIMHRRRVFVVGEQQIRQMLHLPEGSQVKAVVACIDPPSFKIVVCHPDWELVPLDAEAPYASMHTHTFRFYNTEDGHIYERVVLYDSDCPG